VQGRAWREEIPQTSFVSLAFPLSPSCEAVRTSAVFGSAASVEVVVGAEEQSGGGESLGLVEEPVRTGTTVTSRSYSPRSCSASWVSAGGEGVSSAQVDPGFPQPQPQVPLDRVPSTFHPGVLKWSSAWKYVIALDICVSFCEDFASNCVQACSRGLAVLGCGLRLTPFSPGAGHARHSEALMVCRGVIV
jgi:hypothetical protein